MSASQLRPGKEFTYNRLKATLIAHYSYQASGDTRNRNRPSIHFLGMLISLQLVPQKLELQEIQTHRWFIFLNFYSHC